MNAFPLAPSGDRMSSLSAGIGLWFLFMQLAIWFSGAGSSDLHWICAPFWLAALLPLAKVRCADAFSSRGSDDDRTNGRITGGIALLFGAAWAIALACLYGSFTFSAYDLGIYDSIAFNTAHGRPFFSSVQQMNHLGEHFSPIMALFAPLYRLAPSPGWLLLAGLAAYVSVPFAMQRLLRLHHVDARWGPGLALLWFLNAPMASAVGFLFHPSTLAAPLVLLAWDAAARKRWKSLAAWLAFLLLFKESLALAGAGIGLWLLAGRETRRAGTAVFIASLAAGALLAGWAIPAVRGEAWTHVDRIAPLADLPAKLRYVLLLLLPMGVLHARARALLPALPLALLNVSTGFAAQYGMGHHYDDAIVPLLFAGAIGALADGGKPVCAGWRIPAAAVFAAVCVLVPLGPSPLRIARKHFPSASHREVRRSLALLQSDSRTRDGTWFLQTHLDPFVQRTDKTTLDRLGAGAPPENAWAILSPHVPAWPDARFEDARARIADSPAWMPENGFPGLCVFRRRPAENP